MKVKRTKISKTIFKRLNPFFKVNNNRKLNLSKVNTIVLHWTGGSTLQPAIDTLTDKGYGYHFLIDKDGTIIQGARLNDRMSHAGESFGPNGQYVNNYSIGISFVHAGLENEEWPDIQINNGYLLIEELLEIEGLNFKFITGHHEISPGRKIDPYTFPFKRYLDELSTLSYWKAGDSPYTELNPSNGSEANQIKQFNPKLKQTTSISITNSDLTQE